MPSYYAQPLAGQLPLTPPDSGSGYGYSSMHYAQDPYASQQQHMNPGRHDNGNYDFPQGYMQPAVASALPTYQYQPAGYPSANSLPPIQASYYEPIGAPILPPLRINDRVPYSDDYQRRYQPEHPSAAAREQQSLAKEEKATGGVSAKLDYDMERMTDFVTEAAQSIFQSQVQSHPSFRKWVHQVLSATRLPSATILLSLHYLNSRVTNHPSSITPGENQIYRLLAVALVLGSKFLDDNTFVNRSWSDVTAIKVAELNLLEMKWLHLINYELHVDLNTPNGLQAWLDAWKKYDGEYAAKRRPSRLSPLDTNVHRHGAARDRFSPYPSPYSTSARSFDGALAARSSHYPNTPYSSTDPWAPNDRYAQEDYYKRQQRFATYGDGDDPRQRAVEDRSRQFANVYRQNAPNSYYPPSNYNSAWEQPNWSGVHRYDCTCSTCAYQHHFRGYPMSAGYAPQTVMG